MTRQRVKVSAFAHVYAWMFRLGLVLWPLAVAAAQRSAIPRTDWILAAAGVVAVHFLFRYVQRRCSSEGMSYWDGLLLVSASMMTGWTYLSILFVFPALLVAFLASLAYAVYGDARGLPGYAPQRYERLVMGFYRNRMRG